jgi:hypothetical protein
MVVTINKCKGADTSPHPAPSNHKRYPELYEGIRIHYINRDGATRSEVIHRRDFNTIVVKDALNKKRRITIDMVVGYWPEKVVPSSRNLLRLKDIKEFVQQQLVVS